jgi:hypothetical protein
MQTVFLEKKWPTAQLSFEVKTAVEGGLMVVLLTLTTIIYCTVQMRALSTAQIQNPCLGNLVRVGNPNLGGIIIFFW